MSALADLQVPGPTQVPLTEPFWAAAAEGRLLIQSCGSCGQAVFYPRALCPHCWSNDLSWIEALGTARLKSFSQVWKPGHPGWLPAAPYFVGLVTLEEGPTMLSHILTNGDDLEVGDTLDFHPTNIGGRVLPCFKKQQQIGRCQDEQDPE